MDNRALPVSRASMAHRDTEEVRPGISTAFNGSEKTAWMERMGVMAQEEGEAAREGEKIPDGVVAIAGGPAEEVVVPEDVRARQGRPAPTEALRLHSFWRTVISRFWIAESPAVPAGTAVVAAAVSREDLVAPADLVESPRAIRDVEEMADPAAMAEMAEVEAGAPVGRRLPSSPRNLSRQTLSLPALKRASPEREVVPRAPPPRAPTA